MLLWSHSFNCYRKATAFHRATSSEALDSSGEDQQFPLELLKCPTVQQVGAMLEDKQLHHLQLWNMRRSSVPRVCQAKLTLQRRWCSRSVSSTELLDFEGDPEVPDLLFQDSSSNPHAEPSNKASPKSFQLAQWLGLETFRFLLKLLGSDKEINIRDIIKCLVPDLQYRSLMEPTILHLLKFRTTFLGRNLMCTSFIRGTWTSCRSVNNGKTLDVVFCGYCVAHIYKHRVQSFSLVSSW